MAQKTSKKSKLKKKVPIVKINMYAGFNNSIVTLTDLDGKTIAWSSAGKVGFKGTKKATPFAAQKVTEDVLEKVKMVGAKTVHLVIKGAGMGRDSFLRSLQNTDLVIESVKDVTSFPFGGPQPKKRRRV